MKEWEDKNRVLPTLKEISGRWGGGDQEKERFITFQWHNVCVILCILVPGDDRSILVASSVSISSPPRRLWKETQVSTFFVSGIPTLITLRGTFSGFLGGVMVFSNPPVLYSFLKMKKNGKFPVEDMNDTVLGGVLVVFSVIFLIRNLSETTGENGWI